ncbi:helicase-related protein [Enterocloster clostridioformis]|uniref:helicase-related protein n=1 Tax=Enterocloster clostridioformis TaxID=1531 RepID=UPI004068F501
MEDGIHLAQGDSVRTGYSPTVVTWERASARILELLEAGTYLSAAELEQAPDKVLSEMADALLMTARELTKEGREKGLFPQTLAIHDQPKGYPELDADVVAFAKRDGGLTALSEEYHAFLNAYAQDDSITRFRLSKYNTHRIGVVLDGLSYPERSFTAQPDFLRQCKMFITQDEIDRFFLSGSVEERLSVYSHFCYPHTPDGNQKFIKGQFGEYSGGAHDGYDYAKTHKGLTYQREYARKRYDEVKLTIPNVVKTYERLIAQKRFPGKDAIAQIPQYEIERLARVVYFGFSDAPDEISRPYPKNADYYAAVPAIEAQLPDQAKASEMLEALTYRLDGITEGERYFNSVRDAKEQLSAYMDGTFSLFNHKHDAPQQELPTILQTEPEPTPHEDTATIEPEQPQADEPLVLTPPRKKNHTALAQPLDASGSNYCITDDHIGEGAPLERFQRNLDAIRLLKIVEAEGRAATAEEQAVLAQYVGWGGLADFFDEKNARCGELKELLTDAEYAAARESTLTAFYTPPVVIRSIYAALEQMGFSQGNILEPSCGVGNFLGMLPESMTDSKLYGVELDDLSGRIARQLYQRSGIAVQGYEKTAFPDNFFDVAVGNVPFGQFKVADKRYDRLNLSIHEYFIAKTLDKVRPGGVIAFVTSSFTMDKRTANVRKYIAQRAELLGAIRLPNNAFKAAAGTEVVSDILFLQKRDRMVDIEPEWVHLATNDDGIQMNSYFVENPDMVLGEMKMVSGPYGPEPTCAPFPDQPLDSLLANAIQNVHGEITAYDREEELEGEDRSIEADPTVRNFSYTLVDGKIYYRENSRMNPVEVSKTAESRIRGMIELRDCVRRLLEYQTEDYPEEEIKDQQAKLNTLYDAFTRKYGLINSRGNAIAFDQDSSYFLLCSLEVLDEERNLKRKADLFTKRTIRSHKPAEKVDTAVEALALSIGEKAHVDMAYMSQLTGKDEEALFSELKGIVFLNPDYAEGVNEKYLPADEYLSGNVRKKLAEAQAKAAQDPQFQVNADALAKVQPVDLTASEISVRMGATWLNPEYIRQFMFETLGTPRSAQWNIKVHYSKITGEWRIEGKSKDRGNVKALTTYGTKRVNAYEIIEDSLNLKDVRIFDYQYDPDGRRIAVLNKKETAIAQSKQELIKEAFTEWIWKDPERRETICKAYNILFNSNRPREYDGSHINFSGMNPEITLRKHQVNAIAHILYGGNTLLAHVVGAGKTFEMVAAAMESKRLGLCQKSLFVVPNHLTEQWASEFLQLYPAANILVATKKDFETKNRKKFCGRIATGDYDAVIIGHSQFEKIPMSVERQRAILEQQIEEIMWGIQEAKADKAENFTIKQMEKTRKGLQMKLDKLNDQSRKDDVVTFEELGVDRIFIDESHFYKNLFLYTKMRNVGGIAQTEAQKSSDLFMKCRYLDEITGGRGIVFATGTPISNSMVELYTIQRYLQMNALQEQGLQHFDSWAANYGETVTAIELSPEGTGYRAKTRFAKFYNLPELMSVFKNVADIQTADMLKLPVPEAHYHNIALKPSEYQKEMVASLAERAEKVRNREVDSSVDNMLLITNDGRKLALDQRLINPMLPSAPNSKASKCAENVFEIWQRTADQRSTQMIFCDLSTPKGDGSFSVYDDIRAKLLEMGVPEHEIAYIHNAKSEAQKKDLFGKVRSGQVRILLGSTQRMGAGTNCQQKLIALHHLDCPWRPSDLQQREGRIIRQGNENPEVDIYSYVTEGTFDAYLYQLVESKQKFISQIMTSKSPVRSAEDVDEQALSYAEIKALASGNPMIKEKMDLDIEVSKLKLLKANHLSQRYALEDSISKTFPREIAETQARLIGYGADIVTVKEQTHPNADGFAPMTLAGVTYAEKKEAGAALLALCQNMLSPEATQVGSYRGLTLELSFDSFAQEYKLAMIGQLRHVVTLGTDVFGNIQRMDNALDTLPVKEQVCRERLSDLQAQLETAKVEVQKPFAREEELKAKTARLEELNALLNLDKREPEVVDAEPDENQRPPARPAAQMER